MLKHCRAATFLSTTAWWFVILTALASGLAVANTPTVAIAVTVASPPLNGNPVGPTWGQGAHVSLDHEIIYHLPLDHDSTDVILLADKNFLYIGYIVKQKAPVTDSQVTNDVGWGSDDGVGVILWPSGKSGFQYQFESNPSGTHFESSSENTAFQPKWTSVGKRTSAGYSVTMAIPFSVLRGDGRDTWTMQIYRHVISTKQLFVWSYDPNEGYSLPVQFAGSLTGMKGIGLNAKLRPRVSVYGLGELQPNYYGGSTSRVGLDYSFPIFRTASIFGTFHPDYSNVEIDQQTIAPTQFTRVYAEVRPFFTQAASFYNPSGFSDLYTPAIPTPSWGVAYEGHSGPWQFAGFDASGSERNDNAQVLQYANAPQTLSVAFQRVQASLTGLNDVVTTSSFDFGNEKNVSFYGSYAADNGTNVLDNSLNKNVNIGATYYGPKGNLTVNYLDTGLYFNPVDGYVAHPDIKGFNYSANREIDYSPNSAIQKVTLSGYLDSYKDHFGNPDQQDTYAAVGVTTKHNLTLSLSTGSSYLLESGYGLTPFTQQGVGLNYYNTAALPSDVGYRFGHYYNGYLQSFYADSTFALGKSNRTVSLNYYRTSYDSPTAGSAVQTLFRIAFNLEYSRTGTFSVGWRTIAGIPPGFVLAPFSRSANFSAGLSQRLAIGDLYVIYGDPNSIYTTPSLIVKLVHYISGEKGT